MKTIVCFAVITILVGFTGLTSACQKDMVVDGENWTFHRMDDGNSYHELILKEKFEEGTAIKFTLPCEKKYVDAIQIQWGKQNKRMNANLITYPGQNDLGESVRKDRRQETWEVRAKINKIEIQFSGPRDKDAKIRWIRVFYGQNPPPIKEN